MNRLTSLMFGLCLLLAHGALVAADKEHDALVKELMTKSGLVEQVGGIPEQIRATLMQTQQQRGGLSEAQFKELNSMMLSAYNAKSIIRNVEHHIKYNLTSSDIRTILKWLDTRLGKKITRYEEEAASGEAVPKIQQIAASLDSQDSRRLQKLNQLDDVVHATDSTVVMLQGIQIAMTMAMMSGMPAKDQMTMEDLTKRVKSNSEQLYAALKPQVLASLLYSYREISGSELNHYIDFASSKSAVKYHAVTMNALNIAMSKASEDFGNSLRTIKSTKARP